MADEKTIQEQAGLPDNWIPLEVAPIIPGSQSGGAPLPPAVKSNYYSGPISPTMQHDVSLFGTRYGVATPFSPLVPVAPPAVPGFNAAVRSAIATSTPSPSSVVPGGADTDVQVNSNGKFYGDSGFTYDRTNHAVAISGDLALVNRTVATSLLNQSSPIETIQGSYWTGSTSIADVWEIQSIVGFGINPNSFLKLSHTGSDAGSGFLLEDSIGSDVIFNLIAAGNGGNQSSFELSFGSSWLLEISGPVSSHLNAGYMTFEDNTSIALYAGGQALSGESPWVWWGSDGPGTFTGGIQTISGEVRAGLKNGEGGSVGAPGFLSITDANATHRISIRQPASSIASDYNFNLPTTPGSSGQVLVSQGGGSNPMTWETPSGSSLDFTQIFELMGG